jgi:hypothetical protein
VKQRSVIVFVLAVCLAALARPAAAQSDTKAASVAAFDEAARLMGEGQVAEACLKYAESQRLDPQLGTLLYLADCLEKNGQTASAWAAFREAAELAAQRHDARQQVAEERAHALAPRLSKLQINVPPDVDQSTLHIERNDVVVGRALWGAPTPTDPGPHTITVSAPGRRTWKTSAVVRADGSTTIVNVPELEPETPHSPESSLSPSPVASRPSSEPATNDRGLSPSPPRWTALAAAGVGLVGLGVGTVFGLTSKSKRDQADKYCDGNTCTDPRGVELKDEALAAGDVSTVAFVVGGVGLAAGAVLWFVTSPSRANESAAGFRLGFRPAGVVLQQRF